MKSVSDKMGLNIVNVLLIREATEPKLVLSDQFIKTVISLKENVNFL